MACLITNQGILVASSLPFAARCGSGCAGPPRPVTVAALGLVIGGRRATPWTA